MKDNICGAECRDGTDCQRAPMDNGRCYHHGGESTGAPEENQNAQTHALFSDRDGYYQNLPEEQQEWVFDFTNALLDRLRERQDTEPDMFDKEALKNIAIDYHKVAHANDYFKREGMTQISYKTAGESVVQEDQINVWAKEIRQHNESIYRRMKKHGLLDDPESQKADAIDNVTIEVSENVSSTWPE